MITERKNTEYCYAEINIEVFNNEMLNIACVPCKAYSFNFRNHVKYIFWRMILQTFVKAA